MTTLVNLEQFGFTEDDMKTIVAYLSMDATVTYELITKIIKLGMAIKRGEKG